MTKYKSFAPSPRTVVYPSEYISENVSMSSRHKTSNKLTAFYYDYTEKGRVHQEDKHHSETGLQR